MRDATCSWTFQGCARLEPRVSLRRAGGFVVVYRQLGPKSAGFCGGGGLWKCYGVKLRLPLWRGVVRTEP